MDFETTDEANDLLSNGILVETSKGLVCMSLNDALSSNLNLSVEDLKNVAAQLLLQQNKSSLPQHKSSSIISVQPVSSSISNDVVGDSDGFTSESSDVSGIVNNANDLKPTLLTVKMQSDYKTANLANCVSATSTKLVSIVPISDLKHLSSTAFSESENISSNVSDSDASSVIVSTGNAEAANASCEVNNQQQSAEVDLVKLNETHKPPAKKRGGWPKGRKRKPELLHLPPKAPATGYNLFLNDQRQLIKDCNLPFHEKTKLIGNKWSSLTLEEKRPYLEKAEEEKRRYREEFRQYRQSGAYQLYLANKRRKRAKYNVLSESDMDATDDIDDEDNEELYCRTCDQWFHNLHNKREHLQGRQHQQSIAGAITRELNSDYETDAVGTASCMSFSTSLDESSLDAAPSGAGNNAGDAGPRMSQSVADSITNLLTVVARREGEIKALNNRLQETKDKHFALCQQLNSLKETELRLKKQFALLKEQEKDMELKVFHLWQVPSWFVITDLNPTADDYNINE